MPGSRRSTARSETTSTHDDLRVVPANEATWADLRTIFGSRGDPSRCWCQRFRMAPKETWASEGPEELAARLREQSGCDRPDAGATSGVVAYVGAEPVGWCAVAPRPDHWRMLRNNRVPWVGREEDKTDASVWVISCFLTRAGHGGRGLTHALAAAAVELARTSGARVVEGYPDVVDGGHVGTRAAFRDAGLVEVLQPTERRLVMRLELSGCSRGRAAPTSSSG